LTTCSNVDSLQKEVYSNGDRQRSYLEDLSGRFYLLEGLGSA